MKMQKGFTLIELMIVVAIIAILAAIALPAYQNYVARSQATAALADIRGGVTAFEELINRGQLPNGTLGAPTNADLGLQAGTARCTSITVAGAVTADGSQTITCTDVIGNPRVAGQDVVLTRTAGGAWNCTTAIAQEFRPTGCQAP